MTNEVITEWTDENERDLEAFYQEQLAIGMCCDPVDKEGAAKWIAEAYKLIDHAPPEFVFVPSPKAAHELIRKSTNDNSSRHTYLWGQHEVYWMARYIFAKRLGVTYAPDDDKALTIGCEIAQTCMWWWPFSKVCIVSDRPASISLDEQERLHNENGPAIAFRDGFAVYAWRDVTVPAAWIESRDSLNSSTALAVKNVEQRRAACEIIGWDRVLSDPKLNPIVIDEDAPHIGTLIQVDLPDAPQQWFLRYRCATGRMFAEPVTDKFFNTALKANAGGNGWRGEGDPLSFIPFVRT